MNKFFGFLLIGALISVIISATGLDRGVDIRLELVDPVNRSSAQLDMRHFPIVVLEQNDSTYLKLTLSSDSYNYTGVLTLRASEKIEIVLPSSGPYDIRKVCTPDAANQCKFVLRAGPDPLVVVMLPEGRSATIQGLQFDVATANRLTMASGPVLLYGFLLLTLLGPAIVYLRKWEGAEQIALIALGSLWIAMTGWEGLLACYCFLAAGYLTVSIVARTPGRHGVLTISLVSIIFFVAFIKFIGPAIAQSFANIGGLSMALPLGISYFAIRLIDMVLSANARAIINLNVRDFLAFMLIPQALPAGPIVTYSEFQRGRLPTYSIVDFGAGSARVSVGLAKKIAADSFLLPYLGRQTDTFLLQGWNASRGTVLSMLFISTAYIYLDFSAYSDLAIGSGRAAGRRIPENFDWPLVRSNIRNYWRHWHITLSQWVMRRVYLPAFLKTRSVSASMVSCMMVIGLWHALSLPWILWAFHHGLAMAAENRWLDKLNVRLPKSRLLAASHSAVGVCLVWFWVSVGHSFTLFTSVDVAIRSYALALTAPMELVLGLYSLAADRFAEQLKLFELGAPQKTKNRNPEPLPMTWAVQGNTVED